MSVDIDIMVGILFSKIILEDLEAESVAFFERSVVISVLLKTVVCQMGVVVLVLGIISR